jgi:hypothetical protein
LTVFWRAETRLKADDLLAGTVNAEIEGSCGTTFVENNPGGGNLLKNYIYQYQPHN